MQGSSRVTGNCIPFFSHLYSLCCPSAMDRCLDHGASGGDVEPAPRTEKLLPGASALFVETEKKKGGGLAQLFPGTPLAASSPGLG